MPILISERHILFCEGITSFAKDRSLWRYFDKDKDIWRTVRCDELWGWTPLHPDSFEDSFYVPHNDQTNLSFTVAFYSFDTRLHNSLTFIRWILWHRINTIVEYAYFLSPPHVDIYVCTSPVVGTSIILYRRWRRCIHIYICRPVHDHTHPKLSFYKLTTLHLLRAVRKKRMRTTTMVVSMAVHLAVS